ncbi:MAG TPA: sugar ABC transporter permease [Anaerolineales bacterium]|nr:sugar ABC transporter permease [Anaerolineales bacterium]
MAFPSANNIRDLKATFSRGKLTAYFYILPSGLFLFFVLGFPIIYSVFMSFQKYTLETLVSRHTEFIWFENYSAVLSDPAFMVALKHSLVFTVSSILFQFTIGLGLAILFNRAFPLSNVMRGLLLTGWQIPSVVTGTLFLFLFNLDYGLINFVLTALHITSEPIGWIVQSDTALPAVIIANIWLGIPFNVILLSAGVAGLPEDVYEAATVDGANGIQKLIYITIPLLKSTILAVLMLGFIYTLRVFDLIWIMTKGGPGNATEVLPTFAYRLSFINFNFGRSAAVSVIMLLILLGAAILYLRAITKEERL